MAVLFTNRCYNGCEYNVGPRKRLYGEHTGQYPGLFLLFVFLGGLFAACAPDGGETELRNRANLYWKYRSAGQTDLMYDLEYPVLRNQIDKNTYIKRYAPVVKYREPVRPFSINDRWVKADDGVWYHVPKSRVKKK